FEAGQIGLAMRVDFVCAERMAGLDRDDRHADFAPLLTGNANDGGLGHGGELMQHALDLGRIDVLAAGNVHVLPAVDDVIETFLVDPRGVAGVQPAVGEGGGVGVGPVPVTGRDIWAANPEFAELTDRSV